MSGPVVAPADLTPDELRLLKQADISQWLSPGFVDQPLFSALFRRRFLEQHPTQHRFYRITGDGRLHVRKILDEERRALTPAQTRAKREGRYAPAKIEYSGVVPPAKPKAKARAKRKPL